MCRLALAQLDAGARVCPAGQTFSVRSEAAISGELPLPFVRGVRGLALRVAIRPGEVQCFPVRWDTVSYFVELLERLFVRVQYSTALQSKVRRVGTQYLFIVVLYELFVHVKYSTFLLSRRRTERGREPYLF